MNKIVILFLIISIFSVHAFVKRDALEAPKTDFTAQVQDFISKTTEFANTAAKEGQVQFAKAYEAVKHTLETLKPTEAPKA